MDEAANHWDRKIGPSSFQGNGRPENYVQQPNYEYQSSRYTGKHHPTNYRPSYNDEHDNLNNTHFATAHLNEIRTPIVESRQVVETTVKRSNVHQSQFHNGHLETYPPNAQYEPPIDYWRSPIDRQPIYRTDPRTMPQMLRTPGPQQAYIPSHQVRYLQTYENVNHNQQFPSSQIFTNQVNPYVNQGQYSTNDFIYIRKQQYDREKKREPITMNEKYLDSLLHRISSCLQREIHNQQQTWDSSQLEYNSAMLQFLHDLSRFLQHSKEDSLIAFALERHADRLLVQGLESICFTQTPNREDGNLLIHIVTLSAIISSLLRTKGPIKEWNWSEIEKGHGNWGIFIQYVNSKVWELNGNPFLNNMKTTLNHLIRLSTKSIL